MARFSRETGLSGHQDTGASQHTLRSNGHWLNRLRHLWGAHISQAAKSASDTRIGALTAPDKVAFVLLGGGSRGAAQAGALAVALEHGIRPDVIIGVSAGAWNGAYLAGDPTPERAWQLCDIWAGLKTADLLGGGWWRAAISAVSGRPALYGSEGPVRVAHRYLDRQTFEELKVPLYILAANLTNGQPKLFSSGRIVPAMLASSAVPGVFPPVVLDGQVYADGGLLEWDACAEALRLGAQKIYLFACGAIGELSPRLSLTPEELANGNGKATNGRVTNGRKQITAFLAQQKEEPAIGATLLDVLERSWDVVSRFQFQRAVEGLRASGAEVFSIEPLLPLLAHPLDFNHCQMMVEAGRASAEAVFRGEVSASAHTAANSTRIA